MKGIRHIHRPSLLVYSQHSPRLFQLLLDRLSELLPDATKELIAGASHIVHEDNAVAYNSAVLSFIDNHNEV